MSMIEIKNLIDELGQQCDLEEAYNSSKIRIMDVRDFLDAMSKMVADIEDEEREKQKVAEEIGSWLSAALDDPGVSDEMKTDINNWFDMGAPTWTNPNV